MEPFYFFKKDLTALDRQIVQTSKKVKEIGKEIGDSCGEGAETWHDNFAYEQGQRDMKMWGDELRKLIKIRERARLLEPQTNRGMVAIGRTVTVYDPDTGKTEVYEIGSYMIFSKEEPEKENHHRISYPAPLAQMIMLAEEGEERTAEIGGKPKRLIIKKIE